MKAIRIHEHGGPEVLRFEEIPEPQPGPGEVRIRVFAAGVNPADWKMRKNPRGALPMTIGLDVAGMIDKVGDGVDAVRPGDDVLAKLTAGQGGYAEYTVTNASQVAKMPAGLSFIDAAAIPTTGLTAWQALFDTAKLSQGQTVLIHGAAGGVGTFAVQFAKWKGARVIGTASGEHLAYLRDLGADEVIDYKEQRFEEVARNVDVVLDTVGGETFERSWQVLKPGGILVTLIATVPEGEPERRGVRAVHITSHPDGRELAQIADLVVDGSVKPMVTTVLPFTEAEQAQNMSETRHMHGKIVLRVAEEPAERRRAA